MISGALILNSCTTEKTDAEILGGTTWKLNNMFINGSDFMLLADACDKDDKYYFNEDGSFLQDEGSIKCDPSDPQTVATGTWTISADGATFTLSSTLESASGALNTLTEEEFRFTYYDSFFQTDITMVFKPY